MADLTGGIAAEPTSATEYGPSSWFGPYATDYLNKQQALSGMAFTPYSGQLTAGPSNLQSQYFQGVGNLTVPTQFGAATQGLTDVMGSQFDTAAVNKYMNPYLQSVLDPQLAEQRRQSEIQRNLDQSRLTQAGAFGGSRQAILDAERERNLATLQNTTVGQGYATAYDKALAQFNADLARKASTASALGTLGGQEQQAGLANLAAQQQAGATQRDIEQAGLTADYGQYLREFQYPQEQLSKFGEALKAMPAYTTYASNIYGTVPGAAQSATGGAAGLLSLLQTLQNLGVKA